MKHLTTLLLLFSLLLSVLASCQGAAPAASLPATGTPPQTTKGEAPPASSTSTPSPSSTKEQSLPVKKEMSLEEAQNTVKKDYEFMSDGVFAVPGKVTEAVLLLENEGETLLLREFFQKLEGIANEVGVIPCQILWKGTNAGDITVSEEGAYIVRRTLCYFSTLSDVEEYEIPHDVFTIGEQAFAGNPKLRRIVMGRSVETIQQGAFYNMPSLTTISHHEATKSQIQRNIENSHVEYIYLQSWRDYSQAFSRNNLFTSFRDPYLNDFYHRSYEIGVEKDLDIARSPYLARKTVMKELNLSAPVDNDPINFVVLNGVLVAYLGFGGHVMIPEGVTEIRGGVFDDVKDNLISVTLPSTLEKICTGAFFHNNYLDEITLNDSIKEIESFAFIEPWEPENGTTDWYYTFTYITNIPTECKVHEHAFHSFNNRERTTALGG